MKLEEVLPELRKGKKIRDKNIDTEGEYWISGYQSLGSDYKELIMMHMNNKNEPIVNQYSWGVHIVSVMGDDWEIIE